MVNGSTANSYGTCTVMPVMIHPSDVDVGWAVTGLMQLFVCAMEMIGTGKVGNGNPLP